LFFQELPNSSYARISLGAIMPTYEYHCDACGKTQEIVHSIKDDAKTVCPLCHKEALRRILPKNVSLQFKGTGFYITDYADKGKSESKPEDPPQGGCHKGPCGCKKP